MKDTKKLIEIRDLTFMRGSRTIFNDLHLDIPANKVTAIMGPSGTGKTTLLKIIAGQIEPNSGSVLIDGQDVHKIKLKQLYKLRQQMGMLFQSGALLTDINVFDNVAFPLRELTKLSENLIKSLVLMKLESVGLRGAQDLMPHELSGGMARRVALARGIALDPKIMFYDEPFVGQDPIAMGVLIKLIRELNDSLDLTSIIVSHDVKEVLSIADYVCILSEGKIVAAGSVDEMLNSDSKFVQQFIKGLPDGPVPFHYPVNDYLENCYGVLK